MNLTAILNALNLAKLGAKSAVVTPFITTSAGAYTSGDCVGGLITLSDACDGKYNTATLRSIHVKDSAGQAANLTILLFDKLPSGMTTTDSSAFAYGASDGFSSEIAKINVTSADYETIDSKSVACIDNIAKLCQANDSPSLYAVIITTGTPTYGSGTDKLSIKFNFWKD